jgi:hypothetical protein
MVIVAAIWRSLLDEIKEFVFQGQANRSMGFFNASRLLVPGHSVHIKDYNCFLQTAPQRSYPPVGI